MHSISLSPQGGLVLGDVSGLFLYDLEIAIELHWKLNTGHSFTHREPYGLAGSSRPPRYPGVFEFLSSVKMMSGREGFPTFRQD